MAQGLLQTILVLVLAALLASFMSFSAGLARLSRRKIISISALVYVEFFRGTSALVQLFWIFFVLPVLGIELSPLFAAVVALGLNIGAYGAEVVRGAIVAVPRSQYETARAFNFTDYQMMRYIIVPQALVAMIPPFGNLFIELLKATSLVSLITVADLTYNSKLLIANTLNTGEIFFVVLLIYFFLAQVINYTMKAVERRMSFGLDRGGL